ncbi:MAG: ribonuclease R [Bacteroidetes bacterium]|nr:ribonuclease R [Bacteroidota bacterium]
MSKRKKKDENPFTGFLAGEVYKVFNKHPHKTFNHKQLAKLIRPLAVEFIKKQIPDYAFIDEIHDELKSGIIGTLNELHAKGDLIETERGSYKLKPQHAYMEGIIDIKPSGTAYLLSENDEDDIEIAPRNVKNALHGDRVKIYLYARHKHKRMEGEVVEVLKRSKTEFVGKVQINGKIAFVVPDSPKMLVDIFIPEDKIGKAIQGQKVVAEMVDWPKGAKNPVGRIKTIIGWPGENDVEMNSILAEFGFPLAFPDRVEQEANAIPEKIDQKEISKRKDFRSVTTFTIDPIDAKDFDDALSFKKLENGNVEIGVHIADVSHYIRPGSFLDKEAYDRGTSVYLVDRVIPMLPEKLSNGVCSLRPMEDKLCFAAVFEMNDKAQVIKQWFGKTIIHSNKRFHYDEAQAVIETGHGPFSEEILLMQELAKKLRAERFKKGAIAFEKAEVKFKLDEKGKPLGVYLKENKDANKLIEEFMLLANRSVAEWAGRTHQVKSEKLKIKNNERKTEVAVGARAFVYRIHDSPVAEKLQNFARFAGKWGYKLKIDNEKEISQSLNGLMKDLRGKKEQNVLEQLAVRTMSKAVYTTENIGHYGLAFDYYTHFTSPIRRYPDVLVHRLLEYYLRGDESADSDLLEMQCKHSTQMEIRASEAERASIKYKQVEFLQDKLGQVFDGIISGVTEWGLFVEIIENKCEGMVRLRDLDDDFYEFDETNYCVVGTRTKNVYTMGDTVKVMVARCDLLRKQIDFKLISDPSRISLPRERISNSGDGRKPLQRRDRDRGKKKRRR